MQEVDNPQTGEVVDGYSDTDAATSTGIPDPGMEGNQKPLSPDEYAKAQKEAREEDK